ncbi:hypothetical protein FACS1894208_08140 [Clostridia bacterium]|nr:hypothetical protein FACS1894208_08140 [Clostridia bacterium]
MGRESAHERILREFETTGCILERIESALTSLRDTTTKLDAKIEALSETVSIISLRTL